MGSTFMVLGNIKTTEDSGIKLSGFSQSPSQVQSYTTEATDALAEWVQDVISQEKSSNYVIWLLLNHKHL